MPLAESKAVQERINQLPFPHYLYFHLNSNDGLQSS